MLLLRNRALLCIALAVGATLGGCSYDDTNGPGNRVDVSPANDTIVTGATITPDDTLRIEAEVVSEAGVPIPNAPIDWTSSEPTVATVDSMGLVRAVGYGTTRITARSGDREAVALVTVLREEGGSVGIDSIFTQISAGRDFTCATSSLGRAYCWGIDSVEQLGAVQTDTVCINSFEEPQIDEDGIIRNDYECSLLPVRVQSDRTIRSAIAGGMHGCINADNGETFCFGQADSGQTGNGITLVNIDVPTLVTSALQFDGITGGEMHTCGILTGGGGVGYCWGYDGRGQLGNLVRASATTPIPIEGGVVWRQISAGRMNTCGVAVVGAAYCWGDNTFGQLGNPAFVPQSDVPVQVQIGGAQTFINISVNGPTACGVVAPVSSQSGVVYCWGAGQEGQLGTGVLTASSPTPVPVPGLSGIRQVAVGETHVCAISEETSGNLYCWGRYNLDRLRPTPPNEERDFVGATPQKIGTVTFSSITSGRRHSCGVTAEGAAYCWGSNVLGPFGDGLQALLRTEPQRVQTPR